MTELPDVDQALVVRPGDTLILRYSPRVHLTPQVAEELRAKLRARLPDVEVLILGGGIEQFAAYRPEPESFTDLHHDPKLIGDV